MRRERGIATGWLYLGALVVLIVVLSAVVYGIYNTGYTNGKAKIQLEWNAAVDAQVLKELQQSGTAAKSLEDRNAKAKVVYRTITQQVDKYIDRPVYHNLCFDDDGLRDANAALLGSTTPPAKPDGTVSPAAGIGGWFRRLRSPGADSAGGAVPRVQP